MTYHDPIVGADQPAAALRPASGGRALKVAAAVVIVAVVIGGVAVWRFANGFGAPTESATAIPAEAQVYVNFDLAIVRDGEAWDTIVATFPDGFDEDELGTDPLAELDALLFEETGMTLSEDVIPWVGRSAGFATWGVDLDGFEQPSAIVAVKVRDGEAADLFLERLVTSQGGAVVDVVDGVAIWGIEDGQETGFAARAGDMLVAGPDQASVRAAIQTVAGVRPALADDPEYQETIAALPRGTGDLLVYVPSAIWADLGRLTNPYVYGFGAPTPDVDDQLDSMGAGAVTATMVDEGLRFDSAWFTDDPGYGADPVAIAQVPDDALFFAAWTSQAALDAYADLAEAFGDELRDFTGLDPISDVIEPLSGSIAVYGRPIDPLTPEMLDLAFGVRLGLDDPARMSQTVAALTDLVASEEPGVIGVQGDRHVLDLEGNSVLYGVSGYWLDFGWNTDPAADAAGRSITETELYDELTGTLDGEPVFYVDIASLIERYAPPEDEVRTQLRPVRYMAGTLDGGDGLLSGSLLIAIDWAG
jgi:hypothetical protein